MKVLMIGDIVGKPARLYLKEALARIKEERNLDWVIANGENAAGGSGLTERVAKELFLAGIDVLTTGDHAFKKKEILGILDTMDILRPLNYGTLAKGKGWAVIKKQGSSNICVINLVGRVFMEPLDCPFKAVSAVLSEVLEQTKAVIVDMHAEATSEKLAMGYFLAGKASAVIGTHTHIPTADERIINDFTGYITDVGMTGAFDSILGRRKEDVMEKFLTNVPCRFYLAQEDVRIQGVELEIEESSGRCLSIHRVEFKQDARQMTTAE